MIEARSADEGVSPALSRAKAAVEVGDLQFAVSQFRLLLDRDLDTRLRGEVLTNLGAALLLSVRGKLDAQAVATLDQARDFLVTAVPCRSRRLEPAAWATTRANLALVYIARHDATGSHDDLMAAHLALDGVEQTLRESGATLMLDWIKAIRDELIDLGERRSRRR